jgi:nanoRNase/pAp phosphatase (c-di-AMP/oligoRNAs hydrolase)
MDQRIKDQFDALIQEYETFHIFMHKAPDPDSLGAALAMKKVLTTLKPDSQEVKIFGQSADRPQNKTIVSVLNLIFHDPEKAIAEYKKAQQENGSSSKSQVCYIFVDCSGRGGNSDFGIKPHWIVDHHMEKNISETEPGVDLRPYGSASTIMVDYLKTYEVHLSHDDPADASLATALLVGIHTDTRKLVSESMTDFDWEAFRYLQPIADKEKLHQILDYEVPASYFELMKVACVNHEIVGSLLLINLGYITDSTKGGISYMADAWKPYRGMDTVIVFGIYKKVVKISCRVKRGGPIKANDLLRKLFNLPDDKEAGGHQDMAAGEIELKWLDPRKLKDENKQKFLDVLMDDILTEACEITDTK